MRQSCLCLCVLIFAKSFIIHLYFLTSAHHTRVNLSPSLSFFLFLCVDINAHLMSHILSLFQLNRFTFKAVKEDGLNLSRDCMHSHIYGSPNKIVIKSERSTYSHSYPYTHACIQTHANTLECS